MLDILILQALYGLSIPLNKSLLSYTQPFFAIGIRLSISGCILLMYAYYTHQAYSFDKKLIVPYLQSIIGGVYAKYMLRNWALQYLPAITMACLCNITPFVAAAVGYLLANEKVTGRQIIGMLLGCASVLPLLHGGGASAGTAVILSYYIPQVVLFFAIVAHCYGSHATRALLKKHNQSILHINAIRTMGGGLLCLISAWVFEGFWPVSDPLPFAWRILMLVALSNMVCHTWHLIMLRRYSITFLAYTDFLNPLFSALYSYLIFYERFGVHHVISLALIMSGLYLFYLDETGKRYASLQT